MKNVTTGSTYWDMQDNMRGSTYGGNVQRLRANVPWAENADTTQYGFTSTGLNGASTSGFGNDTYIYMAIRRPMKVPTDATTVFKPVAWTGTGTNPQRNTAGFPVDMIWDAPRVLASGFEVKARLIGTSNYLLPSGTSAESSNARIAVDNNVGVDYGNASGSWWNQSDRIMASHYFRRALGFFDVVCYTGTGTTTQTLAHNLGVAPELVIVKCRSNAGQWFVYNASLGFSSGQSLVLQSTDSTGIFDPPISAASSTNITIVAASGGINTTGRTYVAYLFATCPGVSKVGSYTGTGATQTINCGFTGGARFVLIKRTNDVGNWYVWDTARGMVSGTDPLLALNNTDAEINIDAVFTTTGGFQIVNTGSQLNASGGSYIYLAIA